MSNATSSTTPRSQFIFKLHSLLDNPGDPESLRWVNDGTAFEVTVNEARARAALAPEFDFRSLSSFIRQLSYYNFKRLSDRRRSSERRTSTNGFIVFMHPSGIFVKGDPSRLNEISRKARNRPEKGSRRASNSSVVSGGDQFDELDSAPPLPNWSTPSSGSHSFPHGQYSDDRRLSQPFPPPPNSLFQPGYNGGSLGGAAGAAHNDVATWRTYTPPHWNDQRRPSDPGIDMRTRRPDMPRPRVSYHGAPSDDYRMSSRVDVLPPSSSSYTGHSPPIPTGLAMPFDGPSSYSPSSYTPSHPFPSPTSSTQYPLYDSRRDSSHHPPAISSHPQPPQPLLPHERQHSYGKPSPPYYPQPPQQWASPPAHQQDPPYYPGGNASKGEGSR